MAHTAAPQQLQIRYAHTETQVVVQFSIPVNNLQLTPEQVDGMIKGLQEGKALLAEYQRKQAEARGAPVALSDCHPRDAA